MNSHDSERIKGMLAERKYCLTDIPEEADVLLFNTCSVRKHAEDRVVGKVGPLKELKEKRPEVIIGILGCMAEAQKDSIFRKLPHVDFLCGPADLDKIPNIIEKVRSGANHLMYLEGRGSERMPDFSNVMAINKKAYVKIMEGCDNFCSYCIVPYVRGVERSRTPEEILDEIKKLMDKGVKHITLLGQNVNSYGKNLNKRINFPGLLREIDKIASRNLTVDFVTSHPKDASPDLFKAMAELESLSKTLHLPLQSGSNKILKAMNRGYSVGKYKALVRDFRKIVNGSSLKTDFIVGFPGETEKDFEDTLNVMEEIRFDAAYIFKYSPRPFTAASKLKDDVPQAEKERRHAMLLKAQKKISMANAKLYAIR